MTGLEKICIFYHFMFISRINIVDTDLRLNVDTDSDFTKFRNSDICS
jgi:hypothetical protein